MIRPLIAALIAAAILISVPACKTAPDGPIAAVTDAHNQWMAAQTALNGAETALTQLWQTGSIDAANYVAIYDGHILPARAALIAAHNAIGTGDTGLFWAFAEYLSVVSAAVAAVEQAKGPP